MFGTTVDSYLMLLHYLEGTSNKKDKMGYSKFNSSNFLDDLGKAVDSFVSNSGLNDFFDIKNNPTTVPAANVTEFAEYLQIEIAAPGMEKSDFDIEVEGELLIVEAQKEAEKKEDVVKTIRNEFNYATFKRSFRLEHKFDPNGISASYEKGILKLTIAKKTAESKTKIKVDVL